MPPLENDLSERLAALREQNLLRELRRVDSAQSPRIQIDGRSFLNFSSNDYLGLANHPAIKAAAIRAIESFGAGSGASRLVCGSLAPFHQLETALARLKQTEAALAFSSGYAAAQGTISALLGKDDVVILDKLVHACVVDAAKLSGAKIRVFGHNDLDDLDDKLKWAARIAGPSQSGRPRVLIVTESIFSMDGDSAPLRQIVALKERYGAWLMLDEAHATGILGESGGGLVDELGLAGRVEIQMATLGKALGAAGGCICGSRQLIDFLVNRARSFVFSTAPVPAAAAAATEAIRIVQSPEGKKLRQTLFENIAVFRSACKSSSSSSSPTAPKPSEGGSSSSPHQTIGGQFSLSQRERAGVRESFSDENILSLHEQARAQGGKSSSSSKPSKGSPSTIPHSAFRIPHSTSAILPIILGNEQKALDAAAKLREQNIFIPAIRYPTVARGAARLRVTFTAAHSHDDIFCLVDALKNLDIGI
ncbi:MAG TPA: 8-amino-7-oxononanoate synthase [Candidatus Sulfotelmatobacter sp.]|nr:8-amino-7-oxononanoate synthase [Candidatus Sulfotelmatobacter sp.]